LAFLAFSFVVGTAVMWGPGSWNFGGGNYLVKVGEVTVTPKEFLVELQLEGRRNPDLPKEELKNRVYGKLLFRATLAYLALRDGFFVSEEEIEDFVKRNFVDESGNFSVELFEGYLRALGLTPKEFEAIAEKILLADRYKRAVFATSYANEATVEALVLPFKVQVEGKVYALPLERFLNRTGEVSEEELRRFYERTLDLWREEVKNATERVVVYSTPDSREARRLYSLLKEGKKPPIEPLGVFTEESPPEGGRLREAVEEAFAKRGVVVKKLESGNYAVAVYERSAEGGVLPFEEVKEKLEKLYRLQKAREWVEANRERIVKEVLEGRLPAEVQNATVEGFRLLDPETWALGYDGLLELLKGRKVFSALVGDELWILTVERVSTGGQLKEELVENYRLMARNRDYLIKLQRVVEDFLRNHPDEVKVNQKLLQQI